MSYYRTCPVCGAHLDPGEKCDCEKYTYLKKTTKGGSPYFYMEIKEGETPIVNVSEVSITPDGSYMMHIVTPEDRLSCFIAVLANEIGEERIQPDKNIAFQCVFKIDHRQERRVKAI